MLVENAANPIGAISDFIAVVKLAKGMKVLLRCYDEVYRLDCFNEHFEPWCDRTVTIGAFYGKSFWVIEDVNEYPRQFHVDLIRKFENEK